MDWVYELRLERANGVRSPQPREGHASPSSPSGSTPTTRPTPSSLVDLLATTGLETDAVLRDKDTFTDLVSGATNFATGTGWARKSIDQAPAASPSPTTTRTTASTSTSPTRPGRRSTTPPTMSRSSVTGYDSDSGTGTDANIVPMTQHDFVIQPDGSDVTADVPTTGFYPSLLTMSRPRRPPEDGMDPERGEEALRRAQTRISDGAPAFAAESRRSSSGISPRPRST